MPQTYKPLTLKDVGIELICHEETEDPKDLLGEQADIDFVLRELGCGNAWAWFCAEVKVTYGEESASDFLGACSYKSEEDFRQDAYFRDMCDLALLALNEARKAEFDALKLKEDKANFVEYLRTKRIPELEASRRLDIALDFETAIKFMG